MKKLIGFASLLGAVALAPALIHAQPPGPPAATPQGRSGTQVYNEVCASCHGRDLKGGTAKSVFTDAYLKSHTDAQITAAITKGPAGVANHAFTDLTENQVYQTMTYLKIQGGNLNPKPEFVSNPDGEVIKSKKATFHIELVASGLETPWGLAFLPDGRLLVTERPGRLRIITKDGKMSDPVKGTPAVIERQDSGLLDIAVSPTYAKDGWIYMAYTDTPPGVPIPPPPPPAVKQGAGAPGGPPPGPRPVLPPSMTHFIRGKLNANNEWVETQTIWNAPPEIYTPANTHYGTRMLFDNAGHMFFSLGERGDMTNAQKLTTPLGKIHRINVDGTIPTDNPFYNTPGAIKSIWTYGHRNPEGLDFDPRTGFLWETEHGPTGGDEVNLIQKGHNYGWGVISNGLQPGITKTAEKGMESPKRYYVPTVAPSGIKFYTGKAFPAWKNSLFVATLAGGALRRLEISGDKVISDEVLYDNHGRNRAVAQAADGTLYVLLQNPTGTGTGYGLAASTPGRVIRLVPGSGK